MGMFIGGFCVGGVCGVVLITLCIAASHDDESKNDRY